MLEIRGLTKRYGAVTALDGATFTARRGPARRVPRPQRRRQDHHDALHLRARDARAGEVRWDGAPVDAKTRLRFGYMPEQRGLYPRMRVGEQLTYFAEQHGLSGARRAKARSEAWLERLGLADRAKSKLEDLSHGNQQRVQLATALVHDPELLVLDEPFSGLDPIGIATMSEVLRERAAAGVGVVFSSHQLDLVEEVCEDVVIISRGRVVAEGEIEALRRPPAGATSTSRSRAPAAPGSTGRTGHEVLERDGDRVRLLVDERADLGRAARGGARGGRGAPVQLRAAAALGAVHGGGHARRSRSKPEEAAPMSRLRAIRLVAMREILERGRSRGYVLSLVFTVFLLGAGFVLPALLIGERRRPRSASSSRPPAGLEAALMVDGGPVRR